MQIKAQSNKELMKYLPDCKEGKYPEKDFFFGVRDTYIDKEIDFGFSLQ